MATTKRAPPPSGVLVIDKPRGPTSHDVVARLRKKLHTREVGHAGTLDPMATGVLVVAIGEATKLSPYLTAADKKYEATLALGVETDTLDAEGRETRRTEVPAETRAALDQLRAGEDPTARALVAALDAERTRTSQIPPQYSAIKQGGVAAHEKARRGEATELQPRPVCVHALTLLDGGTEPAPYLAIALHVSKGYYVRSLARDLAEGLGTVAHLTALRRAASGNFTLAEALSLDTSGEELEARIIPLARAAERALPTVILTELAVREAGFGRPVPLEGGAEMEPGPYAWLDAQGNLVAVGERDEHGIGRVLRGFHPPVVG